MRQHSALRRPAKDEVTVLQPVFQPVLMPLPHLHLHAGRFAGEPAQRLRHGRSRGGWNQTQPQHARLCAVHQRMGRKNLIAAGIYLVAIPLSW